MVKKIAQQKKSMQEYLTSSLICVKTILTPWRQLQIQPLLAFWRSNLKTSLLLGQENFIIAETVWAKFCSCILYLRRYSDRPNQNRASKIFYFLKNLCLSCQYSCSGNLLLLNLPHHQPCPPSTTCSCGWPCASSSCAFSCHPRAGRGKIQPREGREGV